jgi:pimeloyl-ACP methyl ester carboxylesterase
VGAPRLTRRRSSLLAAVSAAVLGGSLLAASPASGGTPAVGDVSLDLAAPEVGLPLVDVSPPGANDWSCRPSAERPEPVVLVHGTFEDMLKNWSTLAPYLSAQGYCVFALNYGDNATAPVRDSARELASFVDAVLGATGARKVDVVGHSQGGMMPRYWMHHLGGAKKVDDLVGIAPSSHGTQGVLVAYPDGTFGTVVGEENPLCPACSDQVAGSAFMQELNAPGDTVRGPSYTVISTIYDEVVTPYTSQFLDGPARQVTNITIQDLCPADVFEHDQTPNDPVVHQIVAHALAQRGPADPAYRPECVPVP